MISLLAICNLDVVVGVVVSVVVTFIVPRVPFIVFILVIYFVV